MAEQKIHVVLYKDAESDQWVAHCIEYGVTTQGDSADHAKTMIMEAVALHLEDHDPTSDVAFFQPVDGDVQVHEMSMDAPALLHSRG